MKDKEEAAIDFILEMYDGKIPTKSEYEKILSEFEPCEWLALQMRASFKIYHETLELKGSA